MVEGWKGCDSNMKLHVISSVAGCLLVAGTCFGELSGSSATKSLRVTPESLATTRCRISSGDTSLLPALDLLIEQADSALKAGPFSVMNKTTTPPSGSKHDYMSFGPYWWPDPKKQDGLPYIRRDGRRNPASRTNAVDRQSLGNMSDTVATLGLAYGLTGEEVYAGRAAHILRIWFLKTDTKMNPNMEFGQAIPGRVDGRDIGIIDTKQFLPVVDAIDILASSEAMTDKDRSGLVTWFAAYLDWLVTSEHGKDEDKAHNNHGTWYDAQVARFAVFVGKPDMARRVLESSKTRRIKAQIEPDGRQPHELARTKSLGYSVMNLHGMFILAGLGEEVGVDLARYESQDGRSIRKALDFLAPYADPANKWQHEQIKKFDRMDMLPLLRYGTIAYGDERYEELIKKLPQQRMATERFRLLYPE